MENMKREQYQNECWKTVKKYPKCLQIYLPKLSAQAQKFGIPMQKGCCCPASIPCIFWNIYLILGCTNRDNSPFDLSKMTLGKTVNSTFWVLLLFVRRVGQPAQPASLPASQPASLPARLPKLSLPCRAKRGNPHSNAYPNSCVQIKEAWHCCFGRAPSTMGQQSKAAA